MSINVTRSSMPPFDEYCNEIKELWDSHWLTNMGAKYKQLQKLVADYLDVSFVSMYANGHLALENAIESLELPRGGEVITTPFTFVSTTNAISRCGLIPVFCDIRPDNYTIDPDKIEALITDKTVAIVPVHVYGNVCDVEKIEEIAKRHDLKVVYDAAHAFGVRYKGKSIATFGDISMFSFHATKVFNSVEGGCLAFSDEALVNDLTSRMNFGLSGEDVITTSGNAKMSEFHAAMGICNMRHLKEEIAKRQIVAEHYIERLKNIDGLNVWVPSDNTTPNYSYFPVTFDPQSFGTTRDAVFDHLFSLGFNARKYFYPAVNELTCYKNIESVTPVAAKISREVLNLPFYADLSLDIVDKICDAIIELHK